MKSAFELLDRLEEQELLEKSVVKSLRRQMESSDKRLSAKSLASLLVRKGQLTASQARRSLESMPPPPPPEELGLAPDDSDIVEPIASEDIVEPISGVADDDLVPMDESDLVPVAGLDDDADAPAPPVGGPDMDVEVEGVDVATHGDEAIDDDLPSAESGRTVGRKRAGLGGLLASFGRPRRKKVSVNQWDSPLLLVGGGGLLVLTLIGVALYFFLSRGTGDDAFNAANESYRQQAYGQAPAQFRRFLADYPNHPKTSMAKVKIGTSAIWSLVERKQWEDALQTVRTELPKIVGEESFDEGARPELASLLPEIMDGFAEEALAAKQVPEAETLLNLAKQSYEEVNNSAYLPTSVRTGQQPRIEQIQDKLASVERRINRDRELVAAVEAINQLAKDGAIAEAYQRRAALLKIYPTVELDDRLDAATREVAKVEQAAVELTASTPKPLATAPADAALFHVVLSQRRGEPALGVDDSVLIVSTHGAVFGFRAVDGNLLWRTPIGFQSDIPPVSLQSANSDDVVVVRHDTNEVVRLHAKTGELVWRLPCPGAPTSPTLSGGSLFFGCNDLRTETGMVLQVDPNDGTVTKAVTLPVPISVSPMIDSQRNRIIQPADQSTMYVFDLRTFACLGVTYSGHLSRTISVPAVLLGEAILVAENPGVDFTLLHVFGYDTEEPGRLQPLMDPLRLNGQTVVPLGVSDRRAVIVTDRGKISVLELDLNRPDAPLRVTAETASAVQPGTASYALLEGGKLWVGDSQLNAYEVQTSRGQLVRKWINSKGDLFLAPLQRIGDVLFHVRQPAGQLGAAVSAVAIVGGQRREGETIWEAVIAVPPAGEPFVDRDAQEIDLVTGNGALYAVGKEAIRAGLDLNPKQVAAAGRFPLLASSVQTTNHRVFLPETLAANTIVTLQPDARSPLQAVELSLAAGNTVASTPAAFADGLLVAETSGAVNVYDPVTGQPSMDPFQPSTDPLVSTEWLQPAVFDKGQQAVLADKRGNLYHLAVEPTLKRRLVALGHQGSDAGFVSNPLVVGESVYGFVRGAEADVLRRFSLSELKMIEQSDLPGRIAWGPYAVGEIGVFATEPHALVGVDQNGLRFKVTELNTTLIGPPALYENGFVVTTLDGSLVHLDMASGAIKARVKLDETLGSGPIQFAGNRFIVTGGDGTIHVVPLN